MSVHLRRNPIDQDEGAHFGVVQAGIRLESGALLTLMYDHRLVPKRGAPFLSSIRL